MLRSTILSVLGALSTHLRADAALTMLLGSDELVFTSNPPSEATPVYVYIPEVTSVPRRILGYPSYHDGTFTVEVHGAGGDSSKVAHVAELVATLLDDVPVPFDGFATVYVHMAQERRDPMVPGQTRVTLPFTFFVRREA